MIQLRPDDLGDGLTIQRLAERVHRKLVEAEEGARHVAVCFHPDLEIADQELVRNPRLVLDFFQTLHGFLGRSLRTGIIPYVNEPTGLHEAMKRHGALLIACQLRETDVQWLGGSRLEGFAYFIMSQRSIEQASTGGFWPSGRLLLPHVGFCQIGFSREEQPRARRPLRVGRETIRV